MFRDTGLSCHISLKCFGSYRERGIGIFYLLPRMMCATSSVGGLEVGCWLLVPKFAGLNPAEDVGFLRSKKSSARLPSEVKKSRLSHVVDLRHVKDP